MCKVRPVAKVSNGKFVGYATVIHVVIFDLVHRT